MCPDFPDAWHCWATGPDINKGWEMGFVLVILNYKYKICIRRGKNWAQLGYEKKQIRKATNPKKTTGSYR